MSLSKGNKGKPFLLFLVVMCFAEGAFASISIDDRNALQLNFQKLTQSGWDQNAVDVCQQILPKQEYDSDDWDEFFYSYYSAHPLNQNLWFYLCHPTFWWFDQTVHQKLQTGQLRACLAIADSIIRTHGVNLGLYLSSAAADREALFLYLRGLSWMANGPESALEEQKKKLILESLVQLIQDFPQLYKNIHTLSPESSAYMGILRYQLHQIVIESEALSEARIENLIQLLDISPDYASILRKHNLYIADNLRMSSADLEYIDTIMSSIPAKLTKLRFLSNKDYFFNRNQPREENLGFWGSVNTFSTVGGYQENSFPDDVSPRFMDGFSLVVAHEVNHRLDPDYIDGNSRLKERRQSLLNQAGSIDLQYLRSMVGAAYFQSAPQEFLASIANQWFSSTDHTLRLALKRFDRGYKEPINQALFFCELYSLGFDSTRFYEVDVQANVTMRHEYLSRNDAKFIDQISIQDTVVTFALDDAGNVQSYERQLFENCRPQLIYPADNCSNDLKSVTFRWKKIASAKSYRLQISTDSLFVKVDYDFDDLTADSVLVDFSNFSRYYWRVAAKNDHGCSSFSSTRQFDILAARYAERVFGRVFESNGTKPASLTFRAYITTRPGEVLTETSPGCGYGTSVLGPGVLFVRTSNFPTQSHEGEVLKVEVTSVSGMSGQTTKVLLLSADSWLPDLILPVQTLVHEKTNLEKYQLYPNYPNPFNLATTVTFDLPYPTWIKLTISDVTGRQVCRLLDGPLSMGQHQSKWNGMDDQGMEVPSGLYLLRLESSQGCFIRKLTLMK